MNPIEDGTGLELFMDQLPMPCRIYELQSNNTLRFIKANSAADKILQIDHRCLQGLPIDKAFPNFEGSIVPERYLQVLKTGDNWGYHGVYYRQNGQFLGLFHVNAFKLTSKRLGTFLIPLSEEDTDLIFHEDNSTTGTFPIVDLQKNRHSQQESGSGIISKAIRSRVGGAPTTSSAQDDELENVLFTDLFTIEELEAIQQAFTDVTGVASIITMPDGSPLTKPNNFCKLCKDVIRKTPKGLANCIRSDARIGQPNHEGPTIRPCLSGGLWDCGASIIIGDKHVANWLIGQVRLTDEVDRKQLAADAKKIGADEDEYINAFLEVPMQQEEQFRRTCQSLHLFANLLSDMAYQNLRLARSNATQQEIAKELKLSKSRLHHLSSKLIITQEEERKQLAAELHDGIGQSLTAVKYSMDNILLSLDNPQSDLQENITFSAELIKSCIADVRRMQVELRPRILDELGVIATINWFCREFRKIYSHINLNLDVTVSETQVPEQLKPVIFRITQEAFNNAAKYCEGDEILLSFTNTIDSLKLTIKDNGIGFDLEEVMSSTAFNRGLGLDSMRERAELCGGTLEIDTAADYGTTITGIWPIK